MRHTTTSFSEKKLLETHKKLLPTAKDQMFMTQYDAKLTPVSLMKRRSQAAATTGCKIPMTKSLEYLHSLKQSPAVNSTASAEKDDFTPYRTPLMQSDVLEKTHRVRLIGPNLKQMKSSDSCKRLS